MQSRVAAGGQQASPARCCPQQLQALLRILQEHGQTVRARDEQLMQGTICKHGCLQQLQALLRILQEQPTWVRNVRLQQRSVPKWLLVIVEQLYSSITCKNHLCRPVCSKPKTGKSVRLAGQLFSRHPSQAPAPALLGTHVSSYSRTCSASLCWPSAKWQAALLECAMEELQYSHITIVVATTARFTAAAREIHLQCRSVLAQC